MKRIFKALKTPTAKTATLYYLGNFFLNLFRYLFHLVLLRFLTPPEYGEFLSYLSLMYLLAIPTGTITSLVTKVVADFKGRDDLKSINRFFYYLVKQTTPFGIIVGLLLIITATPLATLFKSHPLAFVILGVSTFISLFQTIVSSFLTAFQKFLPQTVLGFVNAIFTIIISILLIKVGLGATGAVLGQIIAGVVISLLTLYQIRDSIFPPLKQSSLAIPTLKNFTTYSFIYSLGTMALMSTDILVVRVLFDTHTSGLYSSLSILGRMILYGLSPLIGLVLPMTSLRFSQRQNPRNIFIKLGAGILILGVVGASVFALFPNLITRILSGAQYLEVANLLGLFAFTMVAFALSQLILSYLMATDRESSNLIFLAATLIQPVAIYIFGTSLTNVVYINFAIHFFLLLSLVIYLLSPQLTALKFSHDQKV